MSEWFPPTEPDDSYLEDGRLPAAAVRALFDAAAMLWTIAPWRYADDDHLLRVDVPVGNGRSRRVVRLHLVSSVRRLRSKDVLPRRRRGRAPGGGR